MAKGGVPGWKPGVLRAARKEVPWTQQELSARTGLSRSAITGYERVDGKAPSPSALRALAGALGLRPRDFIDDSAAGLGVLRAMAGLSQHELVERLDSMDLKLTAYQAIESGRVRRLRHSDATALARVLNVTVEEVMRAHEHDVGQWEHRAARKTIEERD